MAYRGHGKQLRMGGKHLGSMARQEEEEESESESEEEDVPQYTAAHRGGGKQLRPSGGKYLRPP